MTEWWLGPTTADQCGHIYTIATTMMSRLYILTWEGHLSLFLQLEYHGDDDNAQ